MDWTEIYANHFRRRVFGRHINSPYARPGSNIEDALRGFRYGGIMQLPFQEKEMNVVCHIQPILLPLPRPQCQRHSELISIPISLREKKMPQGRSRSPRHLANSSSLHCSGGTFSLPIPNDPPVNGNCTLFVLFRRRSNHSRGRNLQPTESSSGCMCCRPFRCRRIRTGGGRSPG